MKRIEHLSAIAHDIGLVFQFLGVASLLPFVVLVIFQEWDIIIPMASAPATFFILGYLLSLTPRPDDSPPLSVTLVAVALSWFTIALVGALPFVIGLHMSYTDSVFEAMSGWTGSGFTMMASVETVPNTLFSGDRLPSGLAG
jgi:trk system potassium uptake protein TrkH